MVFLSDGSRKFRKTSPSLIPFQVAIISVLSTSPATAAAFNSSATTNNVILWNQAALQAVRDTRMGPPITARALAILHTGIYDAWAAYDPVAVSTLVGEDLQLPSSANTLDSKNTAISYVAYRTLSDLFPTQVNQFNHIMTSLGYDITNQSTDLKTGVGVGNLVAQKLIDFRHQDGSNQLGNYNSSGIPYSDYTGYTSVNTPNQINDPDRWQPLQVSDGHGGFVVQKYLAPHWGNVTPFALKSGDELRPTIGPKTLATDPQGYLAQAQELLDISANLTDEQKVIAEYWADGPASETPPGHWNLFAQFISTRDNHDLDSDVKMFFALNNGLLDASIVAWDAKRAFDSVRPITAIHYLYQGEKVNAWGGPNQGTQEINGEDWQPYQATTFVTPPFPEYISGHSTYSAAAAEILKRVTGSDAFGFSYTQPAGTSFVENTPLTDITLSWNTFSEAADQAGISRRYGGIHFADGDLVGRHLGRQVGERVWHKAQNYIAPTNVPEPAMNWSVLAMGILGLGSYRKLSLSHSNRCRSAR